jgi:hypothetical protein
MLESFERVRVETEGANINAVRRDEGAPALPLLRDSPRGSGCDTSSPIGSPKETDVSPKKRAWPIIVIVVSR